MKKVLGLVVAIATVCAMGFSAAPAGSVGLDWQIRQELKLDKEPLDIASSADGKWLFVLAPGEILVYPLTGGDSIAKIPVDPAMDRLSFSQQDNCIVILSRTGKKVEIIELQEVHDIDVSGLPFKGPENAPVVITIFTDYQCPYCARLEPLISQVLAKYPNQVKYVNKNFPLSNHKFARNAAIAALAAARQDKFWEIHHKLYENMNALGDEKIRQIAVELGVNIEQWEKDMADPAIGNLVTRDMVDAQRAGVRGTPSIYINGKFLKNRSLEGFQAMIEEELRRKQ
ncbi:MAG: thioredoxin domain-containing protein [Deltaproteobacteria bacterium]|nr:thioredoxin domain-containing protein [Deltaproteobacteria bacterium]